MEKELAYAGRGPDMDKESSGPDDIESTGNIESGDTEGYDSEGATAEKDLAETTVSYQEARDSKAKMGPTSSTVEGN